MISIEELRQLKRRVDEYQRPVLSLYAHLNPAHPTNTLPAVLLRVRNTLKALAVPADVARRVVDHFTGAASRPRTLALFANAERLETVELGVDIAVEDPRTGRADARWGEPYYTPLLLVLDEYARYVVAAVGRDQVRFFEVFLGEIDELLRLYRPLSPSESDRLETPRRIHPAHIANRGTSARDDADSHLADLARRFYKDAVGQLDMLAKQRKLGRLIIMGPDLYAHLFQSVLPPALADRVVSLLGAASSPDAAAEEVLARASSVIPEIERAHESVLLDRIREEGLWGVDACLRALQDGRIYALAAAVPFDRLVYRDRTTGYVVADKNGARARRVEGSDFQPVSLMDVLPDLVARYAVTLELIRGENRARLLEELEGIGGLKRW